MGSAEHRCLGDLFRNSGGASHIFFVVRDDSGQSDLLFQTSDTTWQAYNRYGGNSLYTGGPGRPRGVSRDRTAVVCAKSSSDPVALHRPAVVESCESPRSHSRATPCPVPHRYLRKYPSSSNRKYRPRTAHHRRMEPSAQASDKLIKTLARHGHAMRNVVHAIGFRRSIYSSPL